MKHLKLFENFVSDNSLESYEKASKALIDNFDDVRACSYYIDILKKMDKWQDFLNSEDGKLFKELRASFTR